MELGLIFLIFSLVLAVCATFNVPAPPRFNLFAAAFAFFIMAMIFGGVHLPR